MDINYSEIRCLIWFLQILGAFPFIFRTTVSGIHKDRSNALVGSKHRNVSKKLKFKISLSLQIYSFINLIFNVLSLYYIFNGNFIPHVENSFGSHTMQVFMAICDGTTHILGVFQVIYCLKEQKLLYLFIYKLLKMLDKNNIKSKPFYFRFKFIFSKIFYFYLTLKLTHILNEEIIDILRNSYISFVMISSSLRAIIFALLFAEIMNCFSEIYTVVFKDIFDHPIWVRSSNKKEKSQNMGTIGRIHELDFDNFDVDLIKSQLLEINDLHDEVEQYFGFIILSLMIDFVPRIILDLFYSTYSSFSSIWDVSKFFVLFILTSTIPLLIFFFSSTKFFNQVSRYLKYLISTNCLKNLFA